MTTTLPILAGILLFPLLLVAYCPTCGNGVVDTGETRANCPSDVFHEK